MRLIKSASPKPFGSESNNPPKPLRSKSNNPPKPLISEELEEPEEALEEPEEEEEEEEAEELEGALVPHVSHAWHDGWFRKVHALQVHIPR
jgi:hypothetical protein